ncbi:hypothetical protein C8J56DRAFT_898617 [Mycena floridula]|nr:hypothetical protein C8J56DRAFT_898617 [Mycena floridula]
MLGSIDGSVGCRSPKICQKKKEREYLQRANARFSDQRKPQKALAVSQLTNEHCIPVILYDQLGFYQTTSTVDVLVEQLHELIKYLGIEKQYEHLVRSFGTAMSIELLSHPVFRMGFGKLILWSPVASTRLLEKSIEKRRAMLVLKEILENLSRHKKDGTTDSDEYKQAMVAFVHESFCRLELWPEEVFESLSYLSKNADAAFTLFGDNPLDMKGTTEDWSTLEIDHDITVSTLLNQTDERSI